MGPGVQGGPCGGCGSGPQGLPPATSGVTLGLPAREEVSCTASVTSGHEAGPGPGGWCDRLHLWFLSAASPLLGPPLRAEDVSSDDSDEIVIAPSLPEKKPAPHPRSLSARLTW